MSPMCRLQAAILALLLSLVAPRLHAAVSCTINGTVTLEPQDSFYCDTSILGSSTCDNWKEVNLDTTTKPLQYMWITVVPPSGSQASTRTDVNGNWSITVSINAAQCQGQQVDILYKFARLWELNGGFVPVTGAPVFRFWLSDVAEGNPTDPLDDQPGANIQTRIEQKTLGGPVTTISLSFLRTSTTFSARLANAYYTVNSMVKEVATWSENLDDRFLSANPNDVPRIGLEDTWNQGGGQFYAPHNVLISWNLYGAGGIIRHELGHVVHTFIHHEDKNSNCGGMLSRPSCTGLDGCDDPRTCLYGSSATEEALATFFAVRSITTNQTHVWACTCFDGAIGGGNWDVCSDHALATFDPDGESDWFFWCSSGGLTFLHIGDFRSSSPTSCVRLSKEGGCDCTPPMGSSVCPSSYYSSRGWRNYAQITRFLWDLIDSSTDGGQDNADFHMEDVVAAMEGMACIGNQGGVDGSCEEQWTTPCEPIAEGSVPGSSPSRDSYNIYDLSEALPGSQEAERVLNCVQGATD